MWGAAAPLNAEHRYIGAKTGTWTATGGHEQRQKDGKWKWTEEQKEENRQVQVQDQGEVYIQREMDRKTDGDRGKNILGTWKGTAEQEKHDTHKNSQGQEHGHE